MTKSICLIYCCVLICLWSCSAPENQNSTPDQGQQAQAFNSKDQWVFVPTGNGQHYLLEITQDFTADLKAFSGFSSEEEELKEIEETLKAHPLLIKRGQKLPVDEGAFTRSGNLTYRFNGKEFGIKIPYAYCQLLWHCDKDIWLSLRRMPSGQDEEAEFPKYETQISLVGSEAKSVVNTPSYATASFELLASKKTSARTDYLIILKDTPEACMAPGTFQVLAVEGKKIKLLKLYEVMSDAGVFSQAVRHKIVNGNKWEFEQYVEKGDEYDPEKSSIEVINRQFVSWSEQTGFTID